MSPGGFDSLLQMRQDRIEETTEETFMNSETPAILHGPDGFLLDPAAGCAASLSPDGRGTKFMLFGFTFSAHQISLQHELFPMKLSQTAAGCLRSRFGDDTT